MTHFGAAAYKKVDIDTGVQSADPHQLVLMLYDGAIEAAKLAKVHLAKGEIADKGRALGKAVRIVDEGLKASVDQRAGGALATQLVALYEYLTMRLLQANLRNDAAALDEVIRLLDDLRGAWLQIRAAAEAVPPRSATPAVAAAPAQATTAARPPAATPAARFFDATYPQPLRRVVTA
jgi:flagellar protein FliS